MCFLSLRVSLFETRLYLGSASADLCEFHSVEFVVFQGSYRQRSLLVLHTERFNGNGGRCKQGNLRSD